MRDYIFRLSLLVIIPLLSISCAAQEFGIGQWRDHFPYKHTIAVEDAGDRVYTATFHALFYFNKSDNSIQRLSKINGLSDIGIQTIAFHSSLNILIIAYSNTNIDLIKDGIIINISDIKRKQIIGNKSINNIHIEGNYAYLACGFGIVVLDISREEIKDTYYIGHNASHVNVLDVTQNDTALFAATDKGLYSANIGIPNLADFSYWRIENDIPYPDESYDQVVSFANKIILNKNNPGYNTDSLFYFDGVDWNKLEDEFPSDNLSIKENDDLLYVSRNEDVLIYNSSFNSIGKIWSPEQQSINPSDASPDSDGNIWVADKRKGLIQTWNQGSSGSFYTLQSPDFSDVFELKASGDKLWLVSGGYNEVWAASFSRNGFSSFADENWTSFNCNNGECNWPALDTIRDFVDVEIASNDKIYLASWEDGVIVFEDNAITHVYNQENSTLQNFWADPNRTMASGVELDSDMNLWVSNSGVDEILSVKTANDIWYSFDLGTNNRGIDVGRLFVDSYDHKWVIPRRSNSLIVFNDNGTLENTNDDEVKNLSSSTGNGAIISAKINCIAQDKDRELWFGTNEGIGVIYSPRNIFGGGNFDMQRIRVEWDGYVQYLLETDVITAIEVDAANRKWVGTKSSGIYLLSEDGSKQIHHFTTDNSPLISNNIVSIAINDDGEVFVGTDQGLVSYKGEATAPSVDGSDAYAYPNPVPPGYSGAIAVKNLFENSIVKITDISGNVVFETIALGGQAIWNGYDLKGDKVSTGVYLVFASSEDGADSLVAKILFIK